ncbi:MAG: putative Histidine kinase [Candidatus Saccharibacteria bacterium]|nr:putative Histidine kinase [Candidatus Saccharibacteria bacterium]
MFHSATLKLTGWYLLILMVISIVFSFTIYGETTGEIQTRLTEFQNHVEQPGFAPPTGDSNPRLFSAFRNQQREAAGHSILLTLVYVNLLILCGGGVLSYLLARRTLGQIEQAHDAQSRFTSDASHELRTPLAAMRAELEVALRDPRLTKDDMKELLESNLEEVDKLTVLSKTLLQLSKLDHANLELEPVNMGDLAHEVVQRYDKNAKRVKLTVPKEPIIVKANSASLEELLTILVDNALKYSPADSQIKAVLSRQGRQARFEIINKGEGIPSDKLPHIFDRFYRVNDSRADGGSGLGLALAREIVSIHRGELSVSSTPGGHTSFQFLLPLHRKSQA